MTMETGERPDGASAGAVEPWQTQGSAEVERDGAFFALGRLLARTTDVMTVVGGLAIALMMFHIALDVALRYVLDRPIPGTMAIVSYYYMVIAAFVPLAYAEQKTGHISVEVVTEKLPATVQKHLAGGACLLSAIIFGLLAARTWQEALVKHAIGAAIVQGEDTIVLWPTYYVLPIGFGLMALVVGYKFFAYALGKRSGLDAERRDPGASAGE